MQTTTENVIPTAVQDFNRYQQLAALAIVWSGNVFAFMAYLFVRSQIIGFPDASAHVFEKMPLAAMTVTVMVACLGLGLWVLALWRKRREQLLIESPGAEPKPFPFRYHLIFAVLVIVQFEVVLRLMARQMSH